MKTILKTAAGLCAVILIASIVMKANVIIGFAGSRSTGNGGYSAGDAVISQPVRNLDIDWVSGKVQIDYHDEDTVLLTETSVKPISADRAMRWQLDGDTLRVRYKKEGFSFPLFSFGIGQDKELTVTLPKGTSLDEAKISTTSGDILAAAEAQSFDCDATSGDIHLTALGNTRAITANATAGDIRLTAEDAVEKISADTTAGSITIDAADVQEIDAHATAGDVTVLLSAAPGFTASLDTTAGKITYDLPLTKQDGNYICGDGSRKVKISTTAGDIRLEPASR